MNILCVNNYFHIKGGSDAVFFNTMRLLKEAGERVVPFAASDRRDYLTQYSKYFPAGLSTKTRQLRSALVYFYNRAASECLVRLLDEHGPFDISHLHIYYGRLTTSILHTLRRANVPIVQTLHEYKLVCPVYTMERNGKPCELCLTSNRINALWHRCKNNRIIDSFVLLTEFWLSRLLGDVRLIDKFICVSAFQLDLLRRAGIPEYKLDLIYNFVDTDVLKPCDPVLKEDYVLYYGRIERIKGVFTLIEAFAQAGLGVKLKIAGTGSDVDLLRKTIAGHKNIEYCGFVEGVKLFDLVARAHAVVVPSEWYENCPMSVIEAKALGTPVIGSNIGGIPELIRHERDGLLFQAGSLEGLKNALRLMYESDVEKMCLAARKDALERFSPSVYLKRIMSIYDGVMGSVR